MNTKQRGFTLIELMVTIVLASILAAIAVPGFRDLIQNNRAITLSSDFTTAIQLARSEAIKRGSSVTVCAASDTTHTACGGSDDWSNGWIVFSDPNADGVIADLGDRIKVQDYLTTGSNVTTTVARLTFSEIGLVTTGGGSFGLAADGCVGKHGRLVNVATTGRLSVEVADCI